MKKKIMVIGATGLIGNAVAKQLKRDGNKVIVMSRDRKKAGDLFSDEFEIVEADVTEESSIKNVFQGVEGLYISLPEKIVSDTIGGILKYAKICGVEQIIYTSGCTVREENAWHPMIKGHLDAETAIKESGLTYTILRLTMVMDMIPKYANNGKPFIIGKQLHSWSWIYSADIAEMASAAFDSSGAKNKSFTVFGPDKLTIQQAVDKYNSAFNPGTKPAKTKSYWFANLLALFVGENLKYAISIFKYFEDHPEEGNPEETYYVLGNELTGIDEYLAILKLENKNK